MTARSHAIITEANAIRLERCRCGTDRTPTLRHVGTRSKLRRYVCEGCGRIGANAVSVERAARCWNAEIAAARRAA